MKIMSWNIQNGGAKNHIKEIQDPQINNLKKIVSIIEENNPDILVLQEFQYQYWNEFVKNGLKKIGFNKFIFRNFLKEYDGRNGVMICSKNIDMKLKETPSTIDKYSYRNYLEIYIPSLNLSMLALDVPLLKKPSYWSKRSDIIKINNIQYDCGERKRFLNTIKTKFSNYKKLENPAIILGDFNLFDNKKCSFYEYMIDYKNTLKSLINTNTYGDHQNDYIFGNNEFSKKVINTPIIEGDYNCSDHKPIMVEIQ